MIAYSGHMQRVFSNIQFTLHEVQTDHETLVKHQLQYMMRSLIQVRLGLYRDTID